MPIKEMLKARRVRKAMHEAKEQAAETLAKVGRAEEIAKLRLRRKARRRARVVAGVVKAKLRRGKVERVVKAKVRRAGKLRAAKKVVRRAKIAKARTRRLRAS